MHCVLIQSNLLYSFSLNPSQSFFSTIVHSGQLTFLASTSGWLYSTYLSVSGLFQLTEFPPFCQKCQDCTLLYDWIMIRSHTDYMSTTLCFLCLFICRWPPELIPSLSSCEKYHNKYELTSISFVSWFCFLGIYV